MNGTGKKLKGAEDETRRLDQRLDQTLDLELEHEVDCVHVIQSWVV